MGKTFFRAALAASCLCAAPAWAQAEPAPVIAADDRPVPPDGFAASFAAPPRGADGGYATVNAGLSAAAAIWHVRVALNVAALGCRGADEAATAAAYNALLAAEKAPLAAADAAEQAGEQARWGAAWQAHHDDDQTRLYNFWAQPPAQAGFCAVAKAVLAEAAAVPPDTFPAFVATALARLETPFAAAYARWDLYRADLAAWQARRPAVPPLAAATVAPVPVVLAVAAETAGEP